ncbi:hypothetical protein VNO78_02594 [Psophocarpus tetragonolobus]|uniref:Uncharacterized protein n=1 Tax=Psophocarpus tetragonolobus TaxID=3891 RepID=A0AAN9SYW6_PSOTE
MGSRRSSKGKDVRVRCQGVSVYGWKTLFLQSLELDHKKGLGGCMLDRHMVEGGIAELSQRLITHKKAAQEWEMNVFSVIRRGAFHEDASEGREKVHKARVNHLSNMVTSKTCEVCEDTDRQQVTNFYLNMQKEFILEAADGFACNEREGKALVSHGQPCQ